MKRKLILLALFPLLLGGCDFAPDSGTTDLKSIVSMSGNGERYNQEFVLKHDAFSKPSSEFDKDLAMFAYGASCANETKDTISNFYRDMMFSTLQLSDSYDYAPTKNSIAYAFGSRNINSQKVVLVSIRGFAYGAEWSSNLHIGTEGDHAGFLEAAEQVVSDLEEYAQTYRHQNSKFLITGYSRAGAVANLCSKLLFEREKKIAPDENFYVYTFEAAKGSADYHDYPNVFNIVNRTDLVPYIAPEEYGFYRVGQDIYIDQDNIDEIVHNYNDSIVLPAFIEFDYGDDLVTEKNLPQALLTMLTKDSFGEQSISTREQFVQVAQDTIDYVFTMFMTLPSSVLTKIGEDIKTKSMFELLGLITDPNQLVGFLSPYLDDAHFDYDADELMLYATKLTTFIMQGPGVYLVTIYGIYGDDFSRMIYMHFPEVNYALLEAY